MRGRSRRFRRGFTLVEVLVALTAGLLVSAAAYALARNAMKSFQDESRISSTQVGAALGMARLTADIQRAGYMATPNIEDDPKRCASVDVADVPLQAINWVHEGSNAAGELADLGYDLNPTIDEPDLLVLAGNMTSAEQFEYRGITDGTMYLAVERGPTQRAFDDVGRDGDAFCEIFVPPPTADVAAPARFVRIVEASGFEAYLVAVGCEPTVNSGNLINVAITLETPDGGTPDTAGATCGARPGGGLVNPVSIIRYRVGQPCAPGSCAGHPYEEALAVQGDNRVTGEETRMELIREEIQPSEAADVLDVEDTTPMSSEVVAEFVVDFDIAAVHAVGAGLAPSNLDLIPFGEDLGVVPPQRVRSVRVRLGTRARVPDRDEPSPSLAPTRWRVAGLDPAATRNVYARMRTLYSEVQLPNLNQVTW